MVESAFKDAYGSTTGLVLEFIIDGLGSGKYKPGQRLNAAVLCKELSLSKAPVREALHVLAGEGLVDMPKNRGAFIRELSRQDLLKLWEALPVVFSRELRLAARNVSAPGVRQQVVAAMLAIREEAERGPRLQFYTSLHAFHSVATMLAQNPFLISRQQRRLAEFWLPYVFRAVPLDLYLNDYVANYQRVADALCAGDGPSAESAFMYHAAWSAAIIRGEKPVPGGPWSPEPAEAVNDLNVKRSAREKRTGA